MERDTIAAVSTPPGEGALAIIRISGPGAIKIARSLFRAGSAGIVEKFESHRVYYGFILDLKDGKKIDEVFLTALLAPRSYTREDMIEISAHGGMQPVRQILQQALSAGARLAEPGEFTKRAFLNGRLDLAQAEAVMSVIKSRTEAGLKSAVSQLRGFLSRDIEELRREIIGLLALIPGFLRLIHRSDFDFLPPSSRAYPRSIRTYIQPLRTDITLFSFAAAYYLFSVSLDLQAHPGPDIL
jgi:tRNA modification GTPase